MPKLSDLFRVADVLPATVTPEDVDNTYDAIGELFEPTPGQSFDLGPTVDDTNLRDAGGYPAGIADEDYRARPTHTCAKCAKERPKVRMWQSIRYVITADDVLTARPFVATMSGVDTSSVTRVTLVASTENAIRIGSEGPAAQTGAYLPPWFPVTITTGPVWCVGYTEGATLDVLVEYDA